jgi:autotransporter-associated beta strand protein
MRLSQNNSTRTLALGSGGITVNSGVTGVTIGESTGSLFTEATASQTWANNSSGGLTVRRLRASNSASGDVAVTLSANGTGGISFANSIEDSVDGLKKLSIVVDSAGTGTVTLLGSTWTGGTTVKRGVLSTSSATIGGSSVKLGDTSGSAVATLRINTTAAVTTGLIAQANAGTNNLEFIASTSGTYGGNITLNGDLTVGVRNVTNGSAINGAISGTGDLIKGQYQGSGTTGLLTLGGANTHSGDTTVNYGALTLANTGSLTFYIGANGVTNQVNGASAGAVTFNGTFNLNLTGASLVDGNSWTLVNVSNETYGTSFSITSFTDGDADNIWTNGAGFSFDEASGILSYSAIPEPSTYAFFAGSGMLLIAFVRRKTRAGMSA